MKDYLEYKDKKSSKFWEIELEDCRVTVHYGKIGTGGKELEKTFTDENEATLYYKQELAKKLNKGYTDPKVPLLTLENTTYYKNDKPFKHYEKVKGMHYYTDKERVLSYCSEYFYIWSKEGNLLDTFNFLEYTGNIKKIFIRQVGNTSKFIFYVWAWKKHAVYIFDLKNDCFELICNKKLDQPFNYGDVEVDIDEQYIYLVYSDGLILLDDELNIVKILKFPYEDNISAVVNAYSQQVALAREGEEQEQIVSILDMTGKLVSEFETKVTNRLGYSMMTFNKEGTQLYTLYEEDDQVKVQVWNPQDGTLLRQMPSTKALPPSRTLSLLKDEKWLVMLSYQADITLWNLEQEGVEWTRKGQDSHGSVCFMENLTFYQSDGNFTYKSNKDDDEENLEVGGISSLCQSLFYDDKRKQLWVADNNKVFCYSQEGEIAYQTQAEYLEACFKHKGLSKRLVMAKTSREGERVYSWLDLEDLEEAPFLEGDFSSIAFDEDIVVSFEQGAKEIKIWKHNGKLLKTIEINKCSSMYLLKDKKLLISDGKKNEIWSIDEGNLIFAFKETVEEVKVHAYLPYFITAAKNTMKLWDGQKDTPLSVEILAGTVKEIISESFLDIFLIIDDTGRIYTFNPETLELKVLAHINKPIDKATLSATGKLYTVTAKLDLFDLDLKEYLNRQETELCNSMESSCTLILNDESLKQENILQSLKAFNWEKLSEEHFNKLRKALEDIALENDLGEAHSYFTEKMLEQGGKLRHEFADKANYSSFAMSSDGKYLAVGTWMSDDEYNEEDGSIQIWEVASGRCVNLLKDDYAGIGWLDYPCALQWSPDNKRLGVTLNTNQVSSFNPFGMTVKALATAGVTNGWDTPPAWCWIKDSSCFAISCFGNSELPLCICKTNMTRIDESNAKWFKEREGDSEANEEIEPEFQPYTVCHATRNSNLVFGYNNHEEIYGINIKTGQLAWELNSASPVGFSPLDDFFVYLEDEHIQIADLNTGKVKECIPNVESIQGFEFAPNSQRYAAYGENRITIWDYNKKVATFELDSSLLIQDYFECELRPIAFNTSGDKIVCLLDNGDIQVWSLKDGVPSKILTYPSKATGIYWGEALVGVSGEALIFFKEDGTLIRTCDKAAQIAAYNEVYDTVGSPLEIGDEDWMTYGDSSSLYPFKYKEQAEWLVALETGNIISSCKGLKELDPHLSYTWKNKYAWPVSWRKTTVYDTMAQAKVQHI